MTLHLRAARSTDAGKLGQIISEAVAAQDWKPQLHSEAQDIAHMGNLIERDWVTVCEHDQKVAGFLALDGKTIQSLYVAHEDQNKGIGTALLKYAQGAKQSLELWAFQANEGAQRFYLEHGFKEAERTDGAGNDEKLPDLRMIWQRRDKENTNG